MLTCLSVSTPATTDSENLETFKCDWKVCKENHLVKIEYDNDGVLEGYNLSNLKETDQYPWFLGRYGFTVKDRQRYLSGPQWSYPRREDYILDSTKKAILDRIERNKISRSDLPLDILQIIDDPNVSNSQTIRMTSLAASPKVAEIAFELNTRNSLPYEERFSEWSEKRVFKPPAYPCEAHHLLSKQFFGGAEGGGFEDLTHNAKIIGYDVNCYKNGIMLPRFAVDMVCHGLPQHELNHDATEYNKKVAKVLRTVQNECRKYCDGDLNGNKDSQKYLIDRLHQKAAYIANKLIEWKEGYQLRPDNNQRCDAAFNRIKLMLLFDDVDRGYPNVPDTLRKNGKCKCNVCQKEA